MTLERVKDLCPDWKYGLNDECDWHDALSEYEQPFVRAGGRWWEIIEISHDDSHYFEKVTEENGEISFDAIYYNGGCHWVEILDAWLNEHPLTSDGDNSP